MKRLVDIGAAAFGLLLLWPLLLTLAVLIKLDSPGPVFFRQERVGLRGRRFRLFKFRTMTAQPPARDLQITVGDDPRITRIGAVLRRTKLDELPQLIDVLRGTMSLVGPRPEVPQWVERYPPERREQILSVRPGITDLASLKFRNESEILAQADDPERAYLEVILPEKLRVAGNYIDHASLKSDLQLLGLTLRTVVAPALGRRHMERWMENTGTWIALDRWMAYPHRHRLAWALIFDGMLVLLCWHLTYLFRLGVERWQPGRPWYDDLVSLAVVAVYLVSMQAFGVRRALWRYFAFDDFRRLVGACGLAGLISASGVMLAGLVGVSRAVLVLHPLFTVIALAMARMLYRVIWENAHAQATGEVDGRHRVIVLGAGVVARRLIAGLHMRQGWHVLMLLDDDPALHGLRIAGVPVQGPLERLRDPMLLVGATHVVLALAGGDSATQQRALALARETGLEVLAVPQSDDLTPPPNAPPPTPPQGAATASLGGAGLPIG